MIDGNKEPTGIERDCWRIQDLTTLEYIPVFRANRQTIRVGSLWLSNNQAARLRDVLTTILADDATPEGK